MPDSFIAILIPVRLHPLVEFFDRILREMSLILRRINKVWITSWLPIRQRIPHSGFARRYPYPHDERSRSRRMDFDQLIDWRETLVVNHHVVGIAFDTVEV